MKAKGKLKTIVLIVILVAVGALLVWVFGPGRRELPEGENHLTKLASSVSTQGEEGTVTLDHATQAKGGIMTAPLQPTSYREELQAYGVVLELQPLVDLRKNLTELRKNLIELQNNQVAAKVQMEKASLSLEASHKQYERLKALYEDDRNISEKTLQAGEVAWRSDEASLEAARHGLRAAQEVLRAGEEALTTLEASARQQWGRIITEWIFEATPAFERLIHQQDVLIQITLPSEIHVSSGPSSILVQTGTGTKATASLVSLSPRTDPRIQGMTFFYVAPVQIGITPGMNVRAYLPVGRALEGILLPASAVLWWQGKSWVYVQKDPTHFIRREISLENPSKEGWFVHQGLSKGDRIVVKGAQLLLSEEFRGQLPMEEEGEK